MPVALVYNLSTLGSIGCGWLPMYFIKKGWPVFRARKTSMFLYAIAVLPIVFAQIAGNGNIWLAIVIIGIAAAARQAWSANIFTMVSDMFAGSSKALVTGIGGMFGAMEGLRLSAVLQKNLLVHYRIKDKIETAYYIMFAVCSLAYLSAWLMKHILVPGMKRVEV